MEEGLGIEADPAQALRGQRTARAQRQELMNGQPLEPRGFLPRQADAHSSALVQGEPGEIAAFEVHHASARRVSGAAHDDARERRLARAVGA